jgi:hypothetical protein
MNGVRRLWFTVGQLRCRTDIQQIAALKDPDQFLDAAFAASAGNLAVAAAFLPASSRIEGTLAYLCCRALDACEDLTPSAQEARILLSRCSDYLSGHCDRAPALIGGVPERYSDQVEALILSRLYWLRSALDRLPAHGRHRVEKLITGVASEMERLTRARRDRDARHSGEYAERVLGRVVKYSVDLLGIRSRWTVDCGSIARVAQIANDLRDRNVDVPVGPTSPSQTFLAMLLSAIEPATSVPSTLSGLEFPGFSRTRAAVAYVVATSARFYLRIIGVPLSGSLRRPLGAALKCMISARAFTGFLIELEALINVCATTVGSSVFAGAPRSPAPASASAGQAPVRLDMRLSDFETSLALSLPSPSAGLALNGAVGMARTSMQLRANLPAARLTAEQQCDASNASVLLGDYLFAAAVFQLEPLGLDVVAGFADYLAAEAENSERTGALDDERGELAALLTRIVVSASGQYGQSTLAAQSRNRSLGRLYYRLDRTKIALARMRFFRLKQERGAALVASDAPLAPLTRQVL